jgi:hypothetical protein
MKITDELVFVGDNALDLLDHHRTYFSVSCTIPEVHNTSPCGNHHHHQGPQVAAGSLEKEGDVASLSQLHYKFVAEAATVNKGRCKEVLTQLWEVICLNCPEIWLTRDFVLLHDSCTLIDA